MKTAVVAGAAGFIGAHLVGRLRREGYFVRGLDIKKRPDFGWPDGAPDEYMRVDLRDPEATRQALQDLYVDEFYQLAADMGGIGYITTNHGSITRNNLIINLNVLETLRREDFTGKLLFSSSACVYRQTMQQKTAVPRGGLREEDAWPADPEPGYGLEKLVMEELMGYFAAQYGLQVRIARFHNIYGPFGTYEGGREKAPAALVRKALRAFANPGTKLQVWGDGQQTRSFMYVDDCMEGMRRLMESEFTAPINLGSSRMVTIDTLALLAISTAMKVLNTVGRPPKIEHVEGPQGVRGRNCDPSVMNRVLGRWKHVPLEDGLEKVARWMYTARRVGLASPGRINSGPWVTRR